MNFRQLSKLKPRRLAYPPETSYSRIAFRDFKRTKIPPFYQTNSPRD